MSCLDSDEGSVTEDVEIETEANTEDEVADENEEEDEDEPDDSDFESSGIVCKLYKLFVEICVELGW